MIDNNLFLRTSGVGSMTSTETSSALTIKETPISGLAAHVVIPKRDVGDTLQVTIQASTDDSTYIDVLKFETIASITATNTNPVHQVGRFVTRGKYIKSVATVAGTSPDFGAVQIYIGDKDFPSNLKAAAASSLYTA